MIRQTSSILVLALVATVVVANFEDDNLDVEWRSGITVPGTKWCGPGDTAKDPTDLGTKQEEDRCCRSHDLCDHIPAGGEKHGLKNSYWIMTRLHCNCEVNFKRCLKQVNSTLSNRIGNVYFSTQRTCYRNEHPIVKCKETETKKALLRRCVDYEVDYDQEKAYQWFDIPFYDSKYEMQRIESDRKKDRKKVKLTKRLKRKYRKNKTH